MCQAVLTEGEGDRMLTYQMEERGGMSLYDYLYSCIKTDIFNGKLTANEKLPSKRSLAKNLGISVITVENAYSQLNAEGFIYSIEKKGYYVAELSKWVQSGSISQKMPEKSCNCEELCKKHIYADFVSNAVGSERFPFSQWSKLTRQILSEQNEMLLKKAPLTGVYELRCAIAEYLYNFRHVSVSPENIVVGSGTEYLYGVIIQLLGRKKVYAVEDPGYSKLSDILNGNELTCIHVPIDEQGMRMDILNGTNADVVHLTPSHHFPIGRVMSIKRRLEFLDWARESDERYIIEDDYDCEFRLHGKPIQTLYDSNGSDKVIYMNTFSKTLAPSFRISYMILPDKLMKIFNEKMGYMSCTVPNLEQYVLARFMSQGFFERHINRMRVYYRSTRDLLLKEIQNSPLCKISTVHEEDAGLHFLLSVDTKVPDSELLKRADECGIRISFLSEYTYNYNAENEHIIILNYSGIRKESIRDAVERLTWLICDTK